jgi:hypothetical protein
VAVGASGELLIGIVAARATAAADTPGAGFTARCDDPSTVHTTQLWVVDQTGLSAPASAGGTPPATHVFQWAALGAYFKPA